MKKLICCILIIIITLSSISICPAYSKEAGEAGLKLSKTLINQINSSNSKKEYRVYIFLKRINIKSVFDNLSKKYNYDTEAYEDKNLYYSRIVPNIKINNVKIRDYFKSIGDNSNNYFDTISSLKLSKESINQAILNNMQQYNICYQNELSNLISSYNQRFIEKNKVDNVVFKSNCVECIIANIQKEKIISLSKSHDVDFIDYEENSIAKNDSWNSTSITDSDSINGLGSTSFNNGDGYDGSGIKIGVIEAGLGRYDENDYNLTGNSNVSFVQTPNVQSAQVLGHATRVVSLIAGKKTTFNGKTYEGVAKGAQVIQTALQYTTQFVDCMEKMQEEHVNVINCSFTLAQTQSYLSYDRYLDYFIENTRISVIKSSGNKDSETNSLAVTSPGKAYNAIVVGNLCTKNGDNQALYSPYYMADSSCYLENSYLANKPDVVAPGTNIKWLTSSTSLTTNFTGTSYSAPIVTGITAKIMQSNPFFINTPHAIKNYIICGASNNSISGTNVSYGNLFDESGGGLVNAIKSYNISDSNNESYGAFSYLSGNNYITEAEQYINQGKRIRIVLTYFKEEDISLSSSYGNNIDIRLVQSTPSSYCLSSESVNNNVEIIDTLIPTTGYYLIQIRLTNSILTQNGNSDLHYWISWRIY